MFLPAEVWLCCLRDDDRAAVIATAALFTSFIFQPVPEDMFVALWFGTQTYDFAGLEVILELYGLEHTLIIIPDEPPIPAIGIVNSLLWLDIDGFVLTGGGLCSDGCDKPTFLI